jgi:hypothetical protein
MQDNQRITVSSVRHRNRAIVKARRIVRVLLTALASSRREQGNPIGGCLARGILT